VWIWLCTGAQGCVCVCRKPPYFQNVP